MNTGAGKKPMCHTRPANYAWIKVECCKGPGSVAVGQRVVWLRDEEMQHRGREAATMADTNLQTYAWIKLKHWCLMYRICAGPNACTGYIANCNHCAIQLQYRCDTVVEKLSGRQC